MLLNELYQEHRGSSFTHDGNRYDLNKVLRLVAKEEIKRYAVSSLKWVLKYTTVDPERVTKADTKKPILVTRWKGRLVAIDGAHRLTKAVNMGLTDVPARYVTHEVLQTAKI